MNFKGKRLVSIIILSLIILCMVFGQTTSYADGSIFVRALEFRDKTNTAYALGNPNQGGKEIFDFATYINGNNDAQRTDIQKDLYCVKGGKGTISPTKTIEYDHSIDIRTGKTEMMDYPLLANGLASDDNYKTFLCLLNNLYVPKQSTDAADIAKNEELKDMYLKAAGIDVDDYDYPITDDDIRVAQQLAMWHFTNMNETPFDVGYPINGALNVHVATTDNPNYTWLDSFGDAGDDRYDQVVTLYEYLVGKAISDATEYSDITALDKDPIEITNADSSLGRVTESSNYKLGPINVKVNNKLPYKVTTTVKNENDTAITEFTIVNAAGNTVNINNIKTDTEIYIIVPKTSGTNFTVGLNVEHNSKNGNVWVVDQDFTDNAEQPLLEPIGNNESTPYEMETNDEPNKFDLALRKFISAISSDITFGDGDYITNNGNSNGTYLREPGVDVTALKNGTATTATYTHPKTPLKVKKGDYIEYTLRVYNEGEVSGFAEEITDYILQNQGLEFVTDHPTNTAYGWTVSGNKVTTSYLSHTSPDKLLSAFDPATGTSLDYEDLKIVFKVTEPNGSANILVNIAEVTDDKDENNNDVEDRDSTPGSDNKNYPNNPDYNTENHEDDIDYEPVVLKQFDLALRKFITAISSDETFDEGDYITADGKEGSEDNPYLREPVVTFENGKIVYNHTKDPITLKSGDYVLYTLRIFNEGEISGYASLIRDSIPEGLSFEEVYTHQINVDNGWRIDPDKTDGSIITSFLSKDNETTDGENLIQALKKDVNGNVVISAKNPLNPDYKDVKVVLKVTEPNSSDRVLDNRAQIADDTDEHGDEVEDIDSTPDEWEDAPRDDDQDHDPVKLECFDLSLRKYITSIDGKEIHREPAGETVATPKVDTTDLIDGSSTTAKYMHSKDALEVSKGSKVVYSIKVYNEGDVEGFASKVTDYLPSYLKFVPAAESEINTEYGWTEVANSNGRAYETRYLADDSKKLKVREDGSTALYCFDVKIECEVADNAPLEEAITNIAEITEYTEYKNGTKTVVTSDRDSQSGNVTLPTDENLPNYKGHSDNKSDLTDKNYHYKGQQDDDDFEKIIVPKKVDLALTKFITAISTDAKIDESEYLTQDGKIGSKTNPYDRQTAVNTKPLIEGGHDAIYSQVKTPLLVGTNAYVLYNIRVYNEGEVDVYAGEVTDYLPEYLTFVDGEFNTGYGWTANGKVVKTSYLSHTNGTDKILKAFDSENDDEKGSGLDYKDLPILCQVNSAAPIGRKLVNSSEITKYEDKDGNDLNKDIDSTPENLPNDKINKEGNPEGRYDHEDDEDFDVILVRQVDLALTKFITAISSDETIEDGEYLTPDGKVGSEENPYLRQTAVNTKPLHEGGHDAIYTQVKDPLNVNRNAYVLYNIRVYNEGSVDVYAGEVTDYLPENLDFVDCEFNKQYGWTADGKIVKTTYLSYVEENKGTDKDKILKAFDKENDDEKGSGLDYKDLPILCQVNSNTPTAKKLINTAEVTKYQDENGKDIVKDIDSTPENKNPLNEEKRQEDDDDYEVVIVEEFDLSLIKYVSQVIVTEDGQTTTSDTKNTGNKDTDIIPKVEVHRKKLNSTVVKFVYTIRVTNEGDIAGYAKELRDYIPEGLEFKEEDNNGWTAKDDGTITTRLLENTLLQPGESADVKVTFRWINSATNLNLKRNVAEISEDYNDKHVPDRDSVPGNNKWGEDDIDYADVLLSIKTGIAQSYIILASAVLISLGCGVLIIKKYVVE